MADFGLGLALFDFLPVLVAALGFYLLADLLARVLPAARPLLLLGFALVAAGGLCKATWKLIWVLTGVDIGWLDSLLFICMAPGMVLLAMHTVAAGSRWRGGSAMAKPGRVSVLIIVPVLAVAAALAVSQSEGRAWFFVLLYSSALANLAMTILLIRLSWGWRQRAAATLFVLSALLTLSLSWLARYAADSLPLQWLAESVNLVATGSFAVAVWRLRMCRHAVESPGTGVEAGSSGPIPDAAPTHGAA